MRHLVNREIYEFNKINIQISSRSLSSPARLATPEVADLTASRCQDLLPGRCQSSTLHHVTYILQIKSNELPYYFSTGFMVYTLLVLHYYNTLMWVYLCSADILKCLSLQKIIET